MRLGLPLQLAVASSAAKTAAMSLHGRDAAELGRYYYITMGNCCAYTHIPSDAQPEEKALSSTQAELRFHLHTAERVAEVIASNSTDNVVSAEQMATIGATLGLNLTDIDTVDSRLFRFYKNFKAKGGNFDARKLTILGVLLAKGSLKTKVELYFSCISTKSGPSVGDLEVKSMFDALVNIAAVHLLTYSADTPGLTRDQVDDYRERLQTGKTAIVSRLMTTFMNTVRTVERERFLQQAQFHSDFAKCLLSPVRLRTEILTEAANIQKSSVLKEALPCLSPGLSKP